MNATPSSLDEIRQKIRAARRELSAEAQRQSAADLCGRIIQLPAYSSAVRVGFYLSNDGEIDPRAAIENAWSQQKQVYLPILTPDDDRLHFAPFSPQSSLEPNRFGIEEPVCDRETWLPVGQLDLLFMPLVAFDAAANRIGMGGGYYDRSLSNLDLESGEPRPRLIGLAHELQSLEHIEPQPWDIPLDEVITEARHIVARS